MLKLKGITKDYVSGELVVNALKGVDLKFRESEFVSILGPSGCGKTTLLNIIGGLDKYTTGDLEINGVSTVSYKDRDWDNYRNHSIGFVFQSYNLIMHQSVLANVELALTLSGVGKKERRERATQALIRVGLEKEVHKMPNQLSGGQMQRVAIARAIVNDPDIILADEPTGALDTETSVSVMEILKEISANKLVIMVTHNPELAKEYSTRIISMSDGLVHNDTMPVSEEEEQQMLEAIHEKERVLQEEQNQELAEGKKGKKKKQKKAKMSIWTAFSLSLKNLFTKKARTVLTSVAGSIGIIGIALIMSVSAGFQAYIDDIQRDTLSSQPVTLTTQSIDVSGLVSSFLGGGSTDSDREKYTDENKLYPNTQLEDMASSIIKSIQTSNLPKFNEYMRKNIDQSKIHGIKYGYYESSSDTALRFYGKGAMDKTDEKFENMEYKLMYPYSATRLLRSDSLFMTGSQATDTKVVGYILSAYGNFNPFSTTIIKIDENGNETDNWGLIKDQYDKLYGDWAESEVYEDDQGNLYADMMLVVDSYNQIPDSVLYSLGLRSEGHLVKTFVNAMFNMYMNASDSEDRIQELVDKYNEDKSASEQVKKKNPSESWVANLNAFPDFKNSLIEKLIISEFGYNTFNDESDQGIDFEDIVYNGSDEKAYNYKVIAGADEYALKDEVWTQKTEKEVGDYIASSENKERVINVRIKGVLRLKEGLSSGSLSEGLVYSSGLAEELIKLTNSSEIVEDFNAKMVADILPVSMIPAFNNKEFITEREVQGFDEPQEFILKSTVQSVLKVVDKNNPYSISIYASDFDNKTYISNFIDGYNKNVAGEGETVDYSDIMGTLFESISMIVNAITYVLVAFVSISLIVSSIMIGIITYISVLERTKEIGVLRSIGASKGDVGRVFNAETIIIGLVSGLLGIFITILLNIPIRLVLSKLTGISFAVSLPFGSGFALVLISVLLTMVAGLIPSRLASKKDPVVALRTE